MAAASQPVPAQSAFSFPDLFHSFSNPHGEYTLVGFSKMGVQDVRGINGVIATCFGSSVVTDMLAYVNQSVEIALPNRKMIQGVIGLCLIPIFYKNIFGVIMAENLVKIIRSAFCAFNALKSSDQKWLPDYSLSVVTRMFWPRIFETPVAWSVISRQLFYAISCFAAAPDASVTQAREAKGAEGAGGRDGASGSEVEEDIGARDSSFRLEYPSTHPARRPDHSRSYQMEAQPWSVRQGWEEGWKIASRVWHQSGDVSGRRA